MNPPSTASVWPVIEEAPGLARKTTAAATSSGVMKRPVGMRERIVSRCSAVRAGGGKLNLESFTLEGDGLYVRLKGDLPLAATIAAAPLNLTLELMPTAEFLDRQKYVFLLLVKYQKSPGHYEVPIRGTLGKPAIF